MAINQTPTSRTIALPTQTVSAGQGLAQLSQATSTVSQLLSERVNAVAIEQAAVRGQQDAAEGVAPENLMPTLTRATKSYNDAVVNTEARRMELSAQELINEALVQHKNPATFTRETPAHFKAALDGISQGIMENTRDENREHIRQSLDRMTASASINMLQHSIAYDNKQTQADFTHDITGLLKSRKDAAIAGDDERLAGIDAALDSTLADYSAMNQEINQMQPYYRDTIQKQRMVDGTLAGYAHAVTEGTEARYMADLATNKDNLPFDVWQDAVKGVVSLDQTQKRLNNDINAEQWAQVQAGIDNGSIQSAEDIMMYPALIVPQRLSAMTRLNNVQAKQIQQNKTVITAQQNILSNRPEMNSSATRNTMFQASINQLEQAEGRTATLIDMSQSVLGLNQYPASGLPQTAMGANVPAFDSVISGKLTGKDPVTTAQAAMVYNDMVNIQGKPNSVNITGEALAVANLFNELNNGGTPPEQAAQQAIDVVMNAKEPEIAQRIERFTKTLAHINPSTGQNMLAGKFKDAFGQNPKSFGSDEAFRLFQDTYRANYISSNSEEAAFNATKYAMRAWGTSSYFDKGFVGQPVPEKEVPITNVGNAFGNQIVSNLQGYINRNKAAREANPGLNLPVVEWADPKQTITGSESEQDKVFRKMTLGNHPRIKINGHETDVVLMPSATSRLGEGVNYLLGVYDQFNNLNPLKDATNPVDQVARFSPKELSSWAPGIATEETDKNLRSIALKIQQQEARQDAGEFKALDKKTPEWQVIFGLAKPDDYLEYINSRRANSNEGRLNEIIDSLKGKAPAVRDEIADADNVGISMNLEPTL